VFSRAVQQVNLLQPTFVMSVGDLIEGYTTKEDKIAAEWDEFDGFTKQFQMPFFYVPGNHDLANPAMGDTWAGRYGRKHYHFLYKDVLFLAVNTEDPPGKTAVSAAQREDIRKALAENPGVRWTFVFLHKPIWVAKDLDANGWAAVEDLLAGRKYTVFCGHEHRFQKFTRNGAAYYQLATTGGGSRMRGVEYGEFDQVAWVTMKAAGPVIANVVLDGILPEDLEVPASDEPGVVRKPVPTHPTRVTVTVAGAPAAAATVAFAKKVPGVDGKPDRWAVIADGLTNAAGVAALTTYTPNDGVPAAEYAVTVVQTGAYRDSTLPLDANKLDAKYATPATTPLRAVVKAGEKNEFAFDVMAK
jgi:hypothetical protein